MTNQNSTDKPEAQPALAASAGSASDLDAALDREILKHCLLLILFKKMDHATLYRRINNTCAYLYRRGKLRRAGRGVYVVTPNDQDQPRPTAI